MAKLTHARLLCKMEAPSLPIQAASRGEESEGTSGAIQGGVIMRQRNHPSRPAPQLCPLPACEPAAGGGAGCARGCGCVAANCCCVWYVGWESSGLGSQDSGASQSSCGCPAACDGRRVGSSQAAAAACARGTRGGDRRGTEAASLDA